MKLFSDYEELNRLCEEAHQGQKEGVPDPCYLVPAFTGLFCPWWQEDARAILAGITADVTCAEVLYAGVRSSVFQTHDVLNVATRAEGGGTNRVLQRPRDIVVDGGLSNSDTLMQSLADILG